MTIAGIMQPIETDLHRVRETMSKVLQQRGTHAVLLQSKAYAFDDGKLLRPAIVLHCGRALGASINTLVYAAATVELLHIATLIHDDVVDNASVRRGKPTLKETMGNKFAVLGGDFCLANSLRCAAKLGSCAVLELGEAVVKVIEGELMQATSTHNFDMTLEEYVERVAGKTGAIFSLSMRLAAVAAGAPHTIRALAGQFGHYLGIVFQMRDDYLDIFGTSQSLGKPVANDLVQGNITLPLMLAHRRQPDQTLRGRVTNGEFSASDLPAIRKWVSDSGAEDELLQIMQHYADLALAALCCLPPGESRDALSACVEVAITRKR
ncbi:MAG: octaprenyl-diphosphate synthase [Bacillota bacterium]|nr:MAG: octaprenyl-diphosphate synthase [Bacillota bacterium]MBS3950932.1 polyprenyl synthetase family protein [Peptococcaceae bacterium]